MRFITASVCVLFASALAGAKAQLENMLKTIGFYDIICVCAVCALNAFILQTERKSNKKLSKCKRKTPCHGSSKQTKQSTVLGAKMSPKIDPGGLRALAASCARLPRQELSKSALGGLQGRKKKLGNFQGRPWEKFPTKLTKKSLRSAVSAEPVKAYPGGFRPGKPRLNGFKHAHHRKRWSAD